MATYREKLLDPRWQRKRLEIMQRDNFTCRSCEATDQTLHVHHLFYATDRDPWDYPASSLLTLCADCHELEHEQKADAERNLLEAFRFRGARSDDLLQVAVMMDHALYFGFVRDRRDEGQLSAEDWSAISHLLCEAISHVAVGGSLNELVEHVRQLTGSIKRGEKLTSTPFEYKGPEKTQS